MERRYQVFISSTYTDLIEERREVTQALLELNLLPAGMEMFPSADSDQWTLIKRVIDRSDFYVVILGGRYGSTTEEGVSYTEKEFDYAAELGKPIFGFAHADPGSIPVSRSEIEPRARERLNQFRLKVQARHIKTFSNAEDLGSKVSRALAIAMQDTTAEGWVRGRFAMTAETQIELAELRAKVSEMQTELQATSKEVATIPPDLESGDDTYAMEIVMQYKTGQELHAEATMFEPAPLHNHETSVSVTWNDLLQELGPRMFDEAGEQILASALNAYAQRLLLHDHKELLPAGFSYAENVLITQKSFDDIVLQLFALNLTTHGIKPRGVADTNKYWTLSDLGRDTLMKLRAIKKKTLEAAGSPEGD
ncbi:DUF4062 domain-containing protein [Paenarthrobacter sp. A20]|uniref:DUF4062 domain-containing protein n=1 Tax=Paenarthrobacter sp. A20 TaxID=2817891 RepID=UPI00209E58D1|nr:DUF4062 domain-containing protein [Paenarthrobacter sp. A20]MCP1413661.1 hypothetical protein [Paenarthrobacter sp. A20]